jgi:hypothetical protein
MNHPVLTFLLLFTATAVLPACAPSSLVTPVYDETTRTLLRLDYDYDANGVIDVRTYMKDRQPFRLEGDSNSDGVADRWEYYDRAGNLERIGGSTLDDGREDSWAYTSGDDLRLELATGRDGVVDRWEYYRANVLLRTESDTNHDGLRDTWEEYENGRLATVLVDEDRTHGRPTRRLVYAGGAAPRIELDADGDGQFTAAIAAPVSASDKEPSHVTR